MLCVSPIGRTRLGVWRMNVVALGCVRALFFFYTLTRAGQVLMSAAESALPPRAAMLDKCIQSPSLDSRTLLLSLVCARASETPLIARISFCMERARKNERAAQQPGVDAETAMVLHRESIARHVGATLAAEQLLHKKQSERRRRPSHAG